MWNQLKKLFTIKSVAKPALPVAAKEIKTEHALIVTTVGVTVTLDEVSVIEEALSKVFTTHSAGDVDGHEIAVDGSEALFYMYGPDAEAMFSVALPILKAHPATASSRAMLRFGGVSDKNARVDLRLVNDPNWKQ
jgi:hypothetical protein